MLILGIDPGLAIVGYSLIEKKGNKYRVCDYGVIKTSAGETNSQRLLNIYQELTDLINTYQPEEMAVEELFFNKNAKTAIEVGQARGVILLAGAQAGIKVAEYTPLQVKQSVVGYGRATKDQVQQMVKALLNLSSLPKPDDAADALAVAICHGNSRTIISKVKWEDYL
ncbi:MAG TPA: crossover junction endodeoxyribonuclease RuvC [Halanaerobiaceae bacterium]|nr:crossover junction endodeoxyribonuclease RuvC [Bacillota bacterium]HHU91971.1 crossover junction endodeoxyribonuclease RuvC [Halanaerobiaceae bacterium]HOA40851.1 crossover junction endodeoxyribonuclease RuvC [Halanaerobiales bacterium]HPZ62960.1 crossover junction endodeoxyribonuclease RuvC [Halanaerobiales bacterium]HQD04135.1 crossover junction endodeoxyribonuclease RuvC [Halanaerobiales bacterium]